MRRLDFEEILLRIQVNEGGCWPWLGARDTKGYGVITEDGIQRPASRVIYEMAYGPLPNNLLVCHRCDCPPCVRPSHLFPGTQLENQQDMTAKGRGRVGSRNGRCKIKDDQLEEIKRLYKGKRGDIKRLTEQFGINRKTAYAALLRAGCTVVGCKGMSHGK
jgi:hypothetical protein